MSKLFICMPRKSVKFRSTDGGGDSKVVDFANLGLSGCRISVFLEFLQKISNNSDFREEFRNVGVLHLLLLELLNHLLSPYPATSPLLVTSKIAPIGVLLPTPLMSLPPPHENFGVGAQG